MKGGGSMVLVSSAAARAGLPNHEAIAAAKAGVAAIGGGLLCDPKHPGQRGGTGTGQNADDRKVAFQSSRGESLGRNASAAADRRTQGRGLLDPMAVGSCESLGDGTSVRSRWGSVNGQDSSQSLKFLYPDTR